MLKAARNKFVSACAYELPLRPPQLRISLGNQGDAILDEHSNGRKLFSSLAYVGFEFT